MCIEQTTSNSRYERDDRGGIEDGSNTSKFVHVLVSPSIHDTLVHRSRGIFALFLANGIHNFATGKGSHAKAEELLNRRHSEERSDAETSSRATSALLHTTQTAYTSLSHGGKKSEIIPRRHDHIHKLSMNGGPQETSMRECVLDLQRRKPRNRH